MSQSRDLSDYVKQYRLLPFEETQAKFRRALVMEQISQIKPNRILEIGCGESPLFTDLSDLIHVTVVEPAFSFAENARALAENRKNVTVIEQEFESLSDNNLKYDMIILSCLLHEVADQATLLSSILRFCNEATVLHVNVPNSKSLHRLLAVSMGIIDSPEITSSTQKIMQQSAKVYDLDQLTAELNKAGFNIFQSGSMFVKPFTHQQMQHLIDQNFLTNEILEGFYKLTKFVPDLGSEIWALARKGK